MALTTIPQRADAYPSGPGLGRLKEDDASIPVNDLATQYPSNEFNNAISALIDVCTDIGIDGAVDDASVKGRMQHVVSTANSYQTKIGGNPIIDPIAEGAVSWVGDIGFGPATGGAVGHYGVDPTAATTALAAPGVAQYVFLTDMGGGLSYDSLLICGSYATESRVDVAVAGPVSSASISAVVRDSNPGDEHSDVRLEADRIFLNGTSLGVSPLPAPGVEIATIQPIGGRLVRQEPRLTHAIRITQNLHGFYPGGASSEPIPLHYNGTAWELAEAPTKQAHGCAVAYVNANQFILGSEGVHPLAAAEAGEVMWLSRTVPGDYATPKPNGNNNQPIGLGLPGGLIRLYPPMPDGLLGS